MSGDQDHLWTLHGLDEEQLALAARLAEFPEQKQALQRAVDGAHADLAANRAALAALQKQRREVEREIEGVEAQEKKFLGQQAAVKTNDEYQALTHEIAACKRRRSDLETQVLVLMEDEERRGVERPTLERALAAAEADLAERARTIEAAEAVERAKFDAVAARRNAEVAALDPATRPRYERAHVSRAGRAVVPIQKGACGGCFRSLPPQVLHDAKKRDRLLICDGCGRILVLPPEGTL